MALYNYVCSECAFVTEMSKRIADRDETGSDTCPHCNTIGNLSRMVCAPSIGYSVTTPGSYGSKVPDGWKEVLKKIDAQAPGSRMKETSSFL